MISLVYKVTCDGCGRKHERVVVIDNTNAMDKDNSTKIIKLFDPVVPLGWFIKSPVRLGDGDQHFCTSECKMC